MNTQNCQSHKLRTLAFDNFGYSPIKKVETYLLQRRDNKKDLQNSSILRFIQRGIHGYSNVDFTFETLHKITKN